MRVFVKIFINTLSSRVATRSPDPASNRLLSLRGLKNHTNVGIDESKKNNPLNHSHEGFIGKILTQIKLKLNPLRSQLFNYNLTDNPFCPSCNDFVETPLHFFLECNTHHAHRQIMLANLLKLNPNLSSTTDYLQFIVNGSLVGNQEHQMKTNKAIFRHVTIFMFKFQRFISKF